MKKKFDHCFGFRACLFLGIFVWQTNTVFSQTLISLTQNSLQIKYGTAVRAVTANPANIKIWGDETGIRYGCFEVAGDTVSVSFSEGFRTGEVVHITALNKVRFVSGAAAPAFSWVRPAPTTHTTTPFFELSGTGIFPPAAAISSVASYDAAMSDLNRDGLQDLVFRYMTSGGAATNLNIYLRNTDGTFAAPTVYTVSDSYGGIRGTPDLNSDGFPDLVLSHNVPSQIHVRLNNGAGGFGAATMYPVTNFCNGASVFDLDKDGDLDIIAFSGNASLSLNTISVLKNNGDGTFAPQATVNTGVFGTSCQPRDLDNDGDFDILYTSNTAFGSAQTLKIFSNNGSGTLTQTSSLANPEIKTIRALEDFNADGNWDMISVNEINSPRETEIHLANSGLNYNLNSPNLITNETVWPIAGDLDGDGDLDIFAGNALNAAGNSYNDLPMRFYLNDGSGAFSETISADVLKWLFQNDMTDYDSDGDLDWLYIKSNGEFGVALNTCAPTTFYADADGDGFGSDANGEISVAGCNPVAPAGYVSNNNDCDDSNLNIKPDAAELCNDNLDNNCDGQVDETAPTLAFAYTLPICLGSTNGKITANPGPVASGHTYLWNTGATTKILSNVGAGNYNVTVTKTSTGCSVVGTATLGQPTEVEVSVVSIVPATGGNQKVTLAAGGGTPFSPSAPHRFNWRLNGSTTWNFSTWTTTKIFTLAPGTYDFAARDKNLCTDIITSVVVPPPPSQNRSEISFEKFEKTTARPVFSLSPNPVENQFVISLDEPSEQVLKVQILDLAGRQILQKNWSAGTPVSQIETGDWLPGSYFLKIFDEKNELLDVQRVLKI